MKVLVVENDPQVADTLAMAFSVNWPDAGVEVVTTGAAALKATLHGRFDMTVLDVDLPDQSGFTVLKETRRVANVPVIVLSVHSSCADKVKGLESGADDYLTKPFSPFELLARAAAVLRRYGRVSHAGTEATLLQAGNIRVDKDNAQAIVDGHAAAMTPIELRILTVLVQNAGKVVHRDILLREVWGIEPGLRDTNLVKLHIQSLRRKLREDGEGTSPIVNVRGFGYMVPSATQHQATALQDSRAAGVTLDSQLPSASSSDTDSAWRPLPWRVVHGHS